MKVSLKFLVDAGKLRIGEELLFISNPRVKATVCQGPYAIYLLVGNKTMHPREFVTQALGMDPPDHPTKWIMNRKKESLYNLALQEVDN